MQDELILYFTHISFIMHAFMTCIYFELLFQLLKDSGLHQPIGTNEVNLITYHFLISPHLWKNNSSDLHLRFLFCPKGLCVSHHMAHALYFIPLVTDATTLIDYTRLPLDNCSTWTTLLPWAHPAELSSKLHMGCHCSYV